MAVQPLATWRIRFCVFLLSAVILFFEILLMRVFAVQYWHHFASFIISLALLGFGAGGSLLYLLRGRLEFLLENLLFFLPLALSLCLWVTLLLLELLVFNPFLTFLQGDGILQLFLLVAAVFVPFFLGALAIGACFSVAAGGVFRLYFVNLAGSAAGCLLLVLTWFHLEPHVLLLLLSLLAACASGAAARGPRRTLFSALTILLMPLLYGSVFQDRSLEMSSLKDLAQARRAEGAVTEHERFGPLGLVTVLSGPSFHYLPDLSLNCPHRLPEQKGLFIDGNTVGAINRFSGDPGQLGFMSWRTASLAYELLDEPRVLIIGGGGGSEVLNARHHGARDISVVELNADVVSLMNGPYRDYGGAVYGSGPVRVFAEEGRGFFDRTGESYDLIQMVLLDSMGAATAGVYSLNENYLFTVESFEKALLRLSPGGILSVSQWMEHPPRSGMKLLAMAAEVLKRQKLDPSQSLMMIRSWQTVTLLVKKGPFEPADLDRARRFCGSRLFDPCWLPGIRPEETNRFNRLDRDPFHDAALRLFAGEGPALYREYPFDITPATDGRPFFSHSFKMGHIGRMLGPGGRDILPFMDWGYLLAWACFILLVAASLVLILLPLCRSPEVPARETLPVFLFFGALGLAYMFLEIAFLQQFIRYLHHPVYSAAVVIGSFLVFSGLGSHLASREGFSAKAGIDTVATVIVAAGATVYYLSLGLGDVLPRVALPVKMLICSLLIAPLAIPMGIPFPLGLARLAQGRKALLPWAWGVNGFFSVIGASAAVLLAVSWGFVAVIGAALALYILAALVFAKRFPAATPPG
ncbi:MAG: hypothetical protein MUE57_07880 [Syntrophales bacterium]|jgi:spermidine synthase|nr:hypothetical protein [Syntrophales bacterium]